MAQLVEPVEVTYKRAFMLWWNITWRTLGILFLLSILLSFINGFFQEGDNLLAKCINTCLGFFWLFLIVWVQVVVIQGLFIQKFKDFRIIMINREVTTEDRAIVELENNKEA